MDLEQKDEDRKKRRAAIPAAAEEGDKTQRFGLLLSLGFATLTAIAVLALAFAFSGDDEGDSAESEQASAVEMMEDEAASIATAMAETQTEGMTAPADTASEGMTAPADTASEAQTGDAADSAANPAEVILAPETQAAGEAKTVVENGIVKFYFATGKAELAPNSLDALKDVAAGVKEGKKAVVSGYTDSTGNAEINAKLSKERAFAVRDALLAAGVPESSIELRKPASDTGSGSKDEARRVEVILE